MKWFKVYTDILDDPKFVSYTPYEIGLLCLLLAFASQEDKNGVIPCEGKILSWRLRVSRRRLEPFLLDLVDKKILEKTGNSYQFINWEKRQGRPDYSYARIQKYRDKRKALGLTRIGNYDRMAILEKCGFSCVYCDLKDDTGSSLVIDHILPVSLGGTDDIRNLVSSCRSCNSQKAGRILPWGTFDLRNNIGILNSYQEFLKTIRQTDTGDRFVSVQTDTALEVEVEVDTDNKPPIVPRKKGDELFDLFWKNYPRKEGRGAAEKAWKKIKNHSEVIEKMKVILPKQKESFQWTRENGQFIPMPSTYLNQKRWEDEVAE